MSASSRKLFSPERSKHTCGLGSIRKGLVSNSGAETLCLLCSPLRARARVCVGGWGVGWRTGPVHRCESDSLSVHHSPLHLLRSSVPSLRFRTLRFDPLLTRQTLDSHSASTLHLWLQRRLAGWCCCQSTSGSWLLHLSPWLCGWHPSGSGES